MNLGGNVTWLQHEKVKSESLGLYICQNHFGLLVNLTSDDIGVKLHVITQLLFCKQHILCLHLTRFGENIVI